MASKPGLLWGSTQYLYPFVGTSSFLPYKIPASAYYSEEYKGIPRNYENPPEDDGSAYEAKKGS